MVVFTMHKRQYPKKVGLDHISAGKPALVAGVDWNNISNIIAHFRRKGKTVHSHHLGDGLFLLSPE